MALFTTTNYPVNALIEDIDLGKIGLPELQRPFVWPNVNVRNLFDSLYRGYPAGFLLFWETGADGNLKGIGINNEKAAPKLAIVDGQQRLTSLYAVMKGTEVLRANFKKEQIRIAFNPLSHRFDVTDAAIEKDHAYISDISVLWKPEIDLFEIADQYIDDLTKVRELTDEQKKNAKSAIGKLHKLPDFQFVALTLASTVNAETIADVFVRINGEGKKLNQSDFIMTLMSVFWDEGRAELEAFAREATQPTDGSASSFNHYFKPRPDQLLRVTVGLSLRRARLENVYSALKGRDAKSGADNPDKRDEQFGLMQKGQKTALNLANWHYFLSGLNIAGYRSGKMISSDTAIIYSYVLFLIGLRDFKIEKADIRQAIAEFFFMAALTGRYTSSPESRFESDLATLGSLKNGREYLSKLREICSTGLTSDYWTITLPSQLATSAAVSPSLNAYHASLVVLDAYALFSPMKISEALDPSIIGTKSALERHHLFPKGYLIDEGEKDLKKINQIANYALIEWPDNVKIGMDAPSEYVPSLDAKLSATEREDFYFWHALPSLWWEKTYEEFLIDRRVRMASVIKKAWGKLSGFVEDTSGPTVSVAELIDGGEDEYVEFKSTLRNNLHTGQHDEKMHLACLKTIAGFLNAKGGTLIIGVADDGEVLGLDNDGFPNEDKMGLHLVNLVKDRIGDVFLPYVHAHFEDQNDMRILVVRCEKGPKPAYLKDGSQQRFFVRGGNSTVELAGASILDYTGKRF
jgi:hypothetical protein